MTDEDLISETPGRRLNQISVMITGWKVVVKGKRVFEHVNVLPCFDYCVLNGLCTKIVRPIKDKTINK